MEEFLKLTEKNKNEFLNSFNIKLNKVSIKNSDLYIIVFKDKAYENSNKFNDFIRSLRGLIFNTKGEIVSRTYPVPYDFVNEKLTYDNLPKTENSICDFSVEELIDGILLRLTYFNELDKWVLSSNTKIFAKDELVNKFNLCVNTNELTQKLNKNNVYLFMLCDPDNSIVINYTRTKVYYVATIDKSTGNELPLEDLNISTPYIYENLKLNQLNNEVTSYIVKFKKNNEYVRYRFESMSYTTLRLMRGKGPIEHKIINLIRYGNNNVIQVFLYNFPNYIPLFNEINKKIEELPNILYNLYVERFITHKITYVNGPARHKFLLDIHKTYLSNKNSKLNLNGNKKSNVNVNANVNANVKIKSIKLVDIVNKLFITDVKLISSLLN
jgi:hypothetical protein